MRPYGAAWLQFFLQSLDLDQRLLRLELLGLGLGQMQGQDTISLSKAFIREEDGVKYVFLRGEDGRLKRQEIQTGRIFWGDTYEIKSGITSEDWIAFPYGKNVREGARTKEGTINQLYGY